MIERTPLDIVQDLTVFYGNADPRKPGAVISRLPAKIRKILQNLKSSDLENVRVDYLFSKEEVRRMNEKYCRDRLFM